MQNKCCTRNHLVQYKIYKHASKTVHCTISIKPPSKMEQTQPVPFIENKNGKKNEKTSNHNVTLLKLSTAV